MHIKLLIQVVEDYYANTTSNEQTNKDNNQI